MKRPNFFIIGAPKCGTTSLARWLAEHPRIYMSPRKEPFYFDFDDCARQPLSLEEYEALFVEADDRHLAVGEASTRYLQSEVAVSEILNYSPDALFVVMIRNPVEMAYALHGQAVSSGGEPVKDFEKAWLLQDDRARGLHLPPDAREPKRFQYGQICKIGDQLERLYSEVSGERVHVVVLDDMKWNPRQEYLAVLKFLGVPDDGRVVFPVYNTARRARSHLLQRVLKIGADAKIALGIRWRPGLSRLNRRSQPRPPLSDAMRERLQRYFAPQINKIEALSGLDLSAWR